MHQGRGWRRQDCTGRLWIGRLGPWSLTHLGSPPSPSAPWFDTGVDKVETAAQDKDQHPAGTWQGWGMLEQMAGSLTRPTLASLQGLSHHHVPCPGGVLSWR